MNHYKTKSKTHLQKSYQNFISGLFHGIKMRSAKRSSVNKNGRQHIRKAHRLNIDLRYLIELYKKQQGRCAITNIPLVHEYGKINTISIDRINPKLGYINDNLQYVCQFVNLGKSSSSNEHIINFINKIFGINVDEKISSSISFKYAEKSKYSFIKFRLRRTEKHGNITYDYLIDLLNKQNGKCALSGVQMTYHLNDLSSISIDRIDSNIGYEKGNVQLVCKFINLGKNDHSNESVFYFLKLLKDNHEFIK